MLNLTKKSVNVSNVKIGELLKTNEQTDSKFYAKKTISKNRVWAVKKSESTEVIQKVNSSEKVEKIESKNEYGLLRSIILKWMMDSGASRHMTGMLALLYDVKPIRGGYVGFAGNQGRRIVGEGVLSDRMVSFDKVNFIAELENNFSSIS
ncbi:uncharacterized protein LOC110931485 [Helianthus annuus]|uniref:uncharacterized protein LOC110931485 n=1 Tax=Helianthus annuus TaxID=4232 RepID=UPI000B902CCF|nr:uncharacterized protein LOC110931485 [Helianthus annuus]